MGRFIPGFARDIYWGVRNLWRWLPVIWRDQDFDWDALAEIMRVKLLWMAEDTKTWHVVGADKNRKQMLICADILRRIQSGASRRFAEYRKSSVGIPGDTTFGAETAHRVTQVRAGVSR